MVDLLAMLFDNDNQTEILFSAVKLGPMFG
jgi:hypothetical protein